MPAQTKLQWRRDTAANWALTNPVLADGEIGIAMDTKGFKVGDGLTVWNSLPYQSQSIDIGQSSLLLPEGAYLSGSGLAMSGLVVNYGSTPDSIPTSITGDIEIIVRLKLNDWTPSASQVYIGKYGGAGQRSYRIYVSSSQGQLVFSWSADGTTEQTLGSNANPPPFVDGTTYWIRVTVDVDNGSGGKTANFYYAADSVTIPTLWTQIGGPSTTAGTTSIFDSTTVLEFGSSQNGYNNINGILYRAIVKKGIDGIVVVDSDFSTQTANAIAFNATSDTGIKSGGLTLRSISGQAATTPDATALKITGDLELQCKLQMPDWTPSAAMILISKDNSYQFVLNTDGTLSLQVYLSTVYSARTSSAAVPFSDGSTGWVKVEHTQTNCIFYTSADGINWIQLGTSQAALTGTIDVNTQTLKFGARGGALEVSNLYGTMYRAIVKSGIGGTTVFDKDFSEETTGLTLFNAFSVTGIGQDGLVLNGTASQSASVPDANVLDITGDMEIVTRVAPTTWTPASAQRFISKSHSTTNQRSWNLTLWTSGTIILYASADGINVSQAQSTVTVGGVNGQPIWLKVTRRKSDGRVQFFKANDQATEPSSWTQIGADVNILINSDLFSGSATVEFGGSTVDGSNFSGTIYRSILRNGIDGTTVLDANFEAAKIGASSFVESSSNAATVTINGITNPVVTVSGSTDPTVTINTTRYSLGVPNLFAQSVTTGGISANTIYYNPFVIENPISVDMLAFEVTAGPASAANAIVGIYKLDKNGQPIGAPILNSGNIPITASATGMFRKQFTPTIIQPGVYAIAMAVSVTMTIRQIRGGVCAAAPTMGATPYRSLGYATFAVSQGSLPSTPIRWTVLGSSSVASWYQCFMRYTSV